MTRNVRVRTVAAFGSLALAGALLAYLVLPMPAAAAVAVSEALLWRVVHRRARPRRPLSTVRFARPHWRRVSLLTVATAVVSVMAVAGTAAYLFAPTRVALAVSADGDPSLSVPVDQVVIYGAVRTEKGDPIAGASISVVLGQSRGTSDRSSEDDGREGEGPGEQPREERGNTNRRDSEAPGKKGDDGLTLVSTASGTDGTFRATADLSRRRTSTVVVEIDGRSKSIALPLSPGRAYRITIELKHKGSFVMLPVRAY